MRFNKGGMWLLGAALVACLLSTPLLAVEGAGSYRGSGVVIPFFNKGPQVNTWVRFVNGFAAAGALTNETPHNETIDQRNIWVHITYIAPDGFGQCEERNKLFPMTANDLYLLDVNDVNIGSPFDRGYAVAWATEDDDGSAQTDKIFHNHLSADQVTIDLANGKAWGVEATTFRASSLALPDTAFDADAVPDEDDWYATRGDALRYASLGIDFSLGVPQYEHIKYAENFYPTVINSNANLGAGSTSLLGGTRYYVVPISYDWDPDGNLVNDFNGRSVWVPGQLPGGSAYTNSYTFNANIFDSEEARLSLDRIRVRCWDDLTASEIMEPGGSQHLSTPSPLLNGTQTHLGWIEMDSVGFETIVTNGAFGFVSIFNRAIVVQVDELSNTFIGEFAWGFYPVHDRTTNDVLAGLPVSSNLTPNYSNLPFNITGDETGFAF